MRTYRVLRLRDDGTYEVIAEFETSSAEGAIRLAATEYGDGRYVAIPERSWSETPARVETRIVLGDEGSSASVPEPEVVEEDEPEEEPEDDEPEDDDAPFVDDKAPSSPSRAAQRQSALTDD